MTSSVIKLTNRFPHLNNPLRRSTIQHIISPFKHHHRSFLSSSNITPIKTKLVNLSKFTIFFIALIGSVGYLTDTRAGLHSWLSVPLIKFISKDDSEKSHQIAIQILKFIGKYHLIQDQAQPKDELLSFQLWGKKFNNPIGMAAGFDKDGDAVDGLFDIGFGYVEIGSVTPEPQPGNPKPRMFRIPSTQSIINRYGFNSQGHLLVVSKLRQRVLSYLDKHRHLGYSQILSRYDNMNPFQTAYADSGFTHLIMPDMIDRSLSLDQTLGQITDKIGIPRSLRDGRILAVNLGKNKTSDADSIQDFEIGINRFGPLADALIINISSPNTPGLRNLQSKQHLEKILNQIVKSRDNLISNHSHLNHFNLPAILIKIAPDLSVQELVDVGNLAKDSKIDGIIISNTTTNRPSGSGTEPEIKETGGLSGPPLKPLSLKALSIVRSITQGSVALIGCGGITRAEDALEYGKAGADFVQVYSALTYQGIGLPRKLKDGLIELLEKEEHGKTWNQIVGSNTDKIDINQLLLEDQQHRLASSKSSYDNQVLEIKDTIQFIDQKLQKLDLNYQSIFQNNNNFVTSNQQKSQEISNVKETSPTKSTDPENNHHLIEPVINEKHKSGQIDSTNVDHHIDDQQRGILLYWKLKKQDQINRNDFKRIV